jgi:hypothetical protein
MVLPEEDEYSSGTTKAKHHSPRRIVNLKVFQRKRDGTKKVGTRAVPAT